MGIAQAAVSTNSANKIYNITRSNKHTLTLLEAAQLMTKLAGSGTIKVLDRDMNFPSRGRLSIEHARQDFGYDPKIDVEYGFTKYLTWLQYSKFWRKRIYG
jgi:nucleoside-diphosphate-sugar epimerase